MRNKDKRTGKIDSEEAVTEQFNRSWPKRILHTLCLFLPLAAAFVGYFASFPLWTFFGKEGTVTETFKFFVSLIFFLLPTLIIFIITRKENPVMIIKIKAKKDSQNQE